jgi:hypothetical protein
MVYEIALSTRKLISSILDRKLKKMDRMRAKAEFYASSKPKIDPLKLYWIDPDQIRYHTRGSPESYFRLSPVRNGSWDKDRIKLDNIDLVYSVQKHFNENKEWKNTAYYERAKECIEDENKDWSGRIKTDNLDEFKSYLERIDLLYNIIIEDGFKTQRELGEERWGCGRLQTCERHEITVNIGRDGEILLNDGWHRLSISKAIGLDAIPVRIAVRHSKWQKKRRKILEANETNEEVHHPDLIDLI